MELLETVYLSRNISNVFNYYGGVEKCINRILDMASNGEFDITNKPAIQERTDCRRYKIRITNEDYISLRKLYPQKSSTLSLRRLCEWFVYNELYIDWTPESEKFNANTLYKNQLTATALELQKLLARCPNDKSQKVREIMRKLKELLDEEI